uniref:Amino acid transporter transmembrane domain-containing protein n=1 Tax=Graphocephala atropunctata TaxID=36148 RepID=A0A1B6KZD9_9HEMI
MPKSDSPPPSYGLHELKTSSVLELTTHEATLSKEKVREKNAPRDGKLKTSDLGALIHIIKSSMGSGTLAMSYAFSNIGLLVGVFGMAFVALICAHCTHILVKCSQELCYQRNVSSMSYADTVEWAFKLGASRRFSHWSRFMRTLANFFLFITYYGVTTTYVILVATSFKQVIENHSDVSMDTRWYVLILTVILLPVGIVRHIKFLVPFSAIANVFLLIGCTVTIYFCVIDIPPLSSRPMVVEIARWPLFFSTALFAMEGIGTVMPIENSVRKPANFLGCPGVLNIGMVIIAVSFVLLGAIGYIKYGEDIKGSVTLNLPQDVSAETIKILVALAILFTYPLQLTAAIEVVWGGVAEKFSEKNQDKGYYLTRSLLILGTVVIAIALPNLSPALSLVGAIGFSGLGLLMPTVTELVTYWDDINKPCGITVIKAAVLIIFWIIATVSGTITSIQEIISQYNIS